MTHLYKIKDKQGRLVTFTPNYPQLKHLAERGTHRYNLTLKARQFGFTTLYCIDLLDEALWVPGMSCAILGHEREAVDMIFEIVKRAYINLPDAIKPVTKTDTARMLRFVAMYTGDLLDNMIYVALKLRSGTVQRLHVTESAYIKDRQELVAGSKQAVPMTGSISEETTGNGFNDFYDFFTEAQNRTNPGPLEYKAYFYPWHDNPEYTLPGALDREDKTTKEVELQTSYGITDGQLLWRRWKMDDLKRNQTGLGLTGDQLFKQEYPITALEAFQSGAGHVFDPERLNSTQPDDPLTEQELTEQIYNSWSGSLADKQITGMHKLSTLGVDMWKIPVPGHKYVIGVDPSDGEGADYADIDVWDDDKLEQVAQYYGKLRPDELAELTAEIGNYYKDDRGDGAFAGVENNMLTTILFLSKIYPRYYYDTKIDERTQKKTKKIGWNTNTKTRDVMIDDFNILFDDGNLIIHSRRTLGEMKTFVKKDNGKREHADGKHDDALFGGFIAIQMRKFNRPAARVFTTKPF